MPLLSEAIDAKSSASLSFLLSFLSHSQQYPVSCKAVDELLTAAQYILAGRRETHRQQASDEETEDEEWSTEHTPEIVLFHRETGMPLNLWLARVGAKIGFADLPTIRICAVLRLRAGKGGFGKQVAKKGRMYHTLKAKADKAARTQRHQRLGENTSKELADRATEEVARHFRFNRTKKAVKESLGGKEGGDEEKGPVTTSRLDRQRLMAVAHQDKVRLAAERRRLSEMMDICLSKGIAYKLSQQQQQASTATVGEGKK